MFQASTLIPAIVIALILGAIGTLYFGTIRRRRDEAESGVRALSAMRWREFSHFVLDAMRHRGYDVLTPDDEAERGQQTEFLLEKDGERALLSCKHGSAYRLTKQSIAEFVAAMKFQGARSGLLVTPGTIEADARKPAEQSRIELIDGGALWPEIVPLLPQSLSEDVRNLSKERARQQVLLSWLGALVVGVALAFLLGTGNAPTPAKTDMTVLKPKAAAPAPSTTAAAAPSTVAAPVGISAPSTAIVAASPEEEDLQRAEVVRMVATLPGVSRAVWTTKSTLQVYIDETSTQRFDEICTVLLRYQNLRTARVHLQPPENSQQLVRFKQCATM
jgi:hypothetical protein